MDTNKWLCKTFDTENKGYVNIGDIVSLISANILYIGIISAMLFTLYAGIMFILNGTSLKSTELPTVFGLIGLVGVILIIVILIIGVSSFAKFISLIQVAKCDGICEENIEFEKRAPK